MTADRGRQGHPAAWRSWIPEHPGLRKDLQCGGSTLWCSLSLPDEKGLDCAACRLMDTLEIQYKNKRHVEKFIRKTKNVLKNIINTKNMLGNTLLFFSPT